MFADFTNKIRSPTKILWKGCQLRLVGLLGSRGSVMVSWVHCCPTTADPLKKHREFFRKSWNCHEMQFYPLKKNRFWGSQKVQVDLAPKNPTKPHPRFSRPSSHRWLAAVFRPSHWRVPWASAPSLAAPPLVAWRRNGALGTRSRRFKKCWENLYRMFIFHKHTQLIDIKSLMKIPRENPDGWRWFFHDRILRGPCTYFLVPVLQGHWSSVPVDFLGWVNCWKTTRTHRLTGSRYVLFIIQSGSPKKRWLTKWLGIKF